ncbi:MAG: hypothetical protein K2X47_12915, partial [Bdellovibrionales bacterium]|nr:hypothetical protein [Bdellovibrionales bacterium]
MNFLLSGLMSAAAIAISMGQVAFAGPGTCSALILQEGLRLPFDIASPTDISEIPAEPSTRPTAFARVKEALPQGARLSLTKG